MTDVIHDPRTDWCACEPEAHDRCDYRLLADHIIRVLNPPDGDEAEVAILAAAVERIAVFVSALPCTCPTEGTPCDRCAVLGEWHGKAADR